MSLKPGQVLLGKYNIERRLGSGGLGDVYLAEDLQLGRQVAIKHLKAKWASDEKILQRFLQEARVIAALKHPKNIVIIHALEQDDDEHYIVEEYAEKGTVSDLLEEQGELPIEQAVDIAIAVCCALEVVHLEGIVHRDIKPSNIILCESPEGHLIPKLCDFGIAHVPSTKDRRPLTSEGDILGTLQYMSPEQIQGGAVDERSDIYSLGVVLYEMLIGRHVFTGSVAEIWQAQIHQDPVPPVQERPGVSSNLNHLILRALAKNPADRYQKASDMRERLDQIRLQEAEKREKVKSLYDQGTEHLRAGEWEQGASVFQEIMNVDPNHREAATRLKEAKGGLYREGVKCFRSRQWQGAIERFLALVRMDVDYEDVVDKLEEARKQQNVEILYAQGIGYFSKRRWSAAAARFRELLSIEEAYADATAKLKEAERQQRLEALYEQAVHEFEQKNWATAIEPFAEIAEVQPGYRDVRAKLEVARKQQRLEDLYQEGLERFEEQDWSKAIQAFQQALDLDNEFQEAAAKLREVEKQKELSDLYHEGCKSEKAEEWDDAYSIFCEILKEVPGYMDVPERLARTARFRRLALLRKEADDLWIDGNWQAAVDRLDEAVELGCKCEELDRGARKELNSRLRAARKNLKRQEAVYARGMAFYKKRDWPRAAHEFRRVLELNPKHQDAFVRLKEAEEKGGGVVQTTPGESLGTPSRLQTAGGLFDWKKIAQEVVITGILGTIVSAILDKYILDLDLGRLMLLVLGVVMIVVASSMIYDSFFRQDG
jgi:outer membrane protein assembly factor BamD (BamD/ComL family)